jgi:hypothetical protein
MVFQNGEFRMKKPQVEIKFRKVVQFTDLNAPIVITIMKAAEKGIHGNDLYHFIYEEPGDFYTEILTLAEIETRVALTEYSQRIAKLLKEIENEKT